MALTFIMAVVLLAVLILGTLASVLKHKPATEPPAKIQGGVPPLVVAACTLPVAAFVFYLAMGYPMLHQILPPSAVDTLFVVLHVLAPLAAGGVCVFYYFKMGRRLRFFLLFWAMLVLAAIGTGTWATSGM